MSRPRFSIVIPTRNRVATLPFTLRTCLEQDFDDYEVVVSDNGDDDAVRQLVEELASPRLRYVHTPRPLAMSDSWDFAVGQAQGEYVTIVGSDDALLGHCLRDLHGILGRIDAQAIRWQSALYTWPTLASQAHLLPNRLAIPLPRVGSAHLVRRVESRAAICDAVSGRIPYSDLPMIYSAAIRRDLLAELRDKTGKLFLGYAPDVYSAFAIAHTAGCFYSVDTPLAISGLSGGSTGIATILAKNKSEIAREFDAMNAQAGYIAHPSVPALPAMAAAVADSFLQAKQALFPDDMGLALDRKYVVRTCLNQIAFASDEEWREGLRIAAESLADDADLTAWFAGEYHQASRPAIPEPWRARLCTGELLHLEADHFGVRDIHAAVNLCDRLFAYRSEQVTYHLDPENTLSDPGTLAAHRLRCIEGLEAAKREHLALIHKLEVRLAQFGIKELAGRAFKSVRRLLAG